MKNKRNIMEFLFLQLFLFPILPLEFSLLSHLVEASNSSVSVQWSCHDDEMSALLKFKRSFIIDRSASYYSNAYPKVSSWKFEGESSNCCFWDGVECDEETGHVISLDLSSSFLSGSINSNSSLFCLLHLRNLNLADNDFNMSRIPAAIGRLSRLTYLNLSYSQFSGQIPSEVSHLSKLSSLDLSRNFDQNGKKSLQLRNPNFQGFVQNLTSLEYLNLAQVDISSTVPDFLVNFSSLRFLSLAESGLFGQFPGEIFQLPNLQILSLQENKKLTGCFPEFHTRSPLRELWLKDTSFSGKIPPSIEKLDSLAILDLCGCNFFGSIPSSFGKLTQLTTLDLGKNNLSGSVPSSFQNLTQLVELSVESNSLGGTMKFDMFFQMQSLSRLVLSGNKFSLFFGLNDSFPKLISLQLSSCKLSAFPNFLRHQNKLQTLDLSQNIIHGQIPLWMWNTSTDTLDILDLSNNFLTAFHPSSKNLPWVRLRFMDLTSNMIQGPLPIPSPAIEDYAIALNNLTGEIPPLICNLSSLQILDLSSNKLIGKLPSCLGNSSDSLTELTVGNNLFHGAIPDLCSTIRTTKLSMTDFSHNQFQGQLPRSFSTCTRLKYFSVARNQLEDVFPAWMGTLPQLQILKLSHNKFYGIIGKPKRSSEFAKLRIIDLSFNNFIGNLPSEYMVIWKAMKVAGVKDSTYITSYNKLLDPMGIKKTSIVYFDYSITITVKGLRRNYPKILRIFTFVDLSSNKFSGKIPQVIGELKGLHSFNLSNNMLTGFIPPSLGNLTELESLDLSHNNLSGEIPQQLLQLTFLEYFDVSHNSLMGQIPQGNQFSTFGQSSFEDNPGLCGAPLETKCESLPPSEENDDLGHPLGLDWRFVLAGTISGFVVGFAMGDMVMTRERQALLFEAFKGMLHA